MEFKEQLNSWIQLNDPINVKNVLSTNEMEAYRHILTSSSLEGSYVTSSASITGPGAEKTKNENNLDTNFGLAAINLANMARISAQYFPVGNNRKEKEYNDYKKRLASCPLFTITLSTFNEITRKSSNWNDLIEDIADTFDGINNEDRKQVKGDLIRLANTAASKSKTTETEDILAQNVVDVNDDVNYYLYDTKVSFFHEKKKKEVKQSTFRVTRLKLRFLKDLWPEVSEVMNKKVIVSVKDWLDSNNTKSEDDNKKPLTCIS